MDTVWYSCRLTLLSVQVRMVKSAAEAMGKQRRTNQCRAIMMEASFRPRACHCNVIQNLVAQGTGLARSGTMREETMTEYNGRQQKGLNR